MSEKGNSALPEGATEAGELLNSLRRLASAFFWLFSIVGTVVAIVAANMAVRLFEAPSKPLRDAQAFEANASDFALRAGEFGRELKDSAADQNSAAYSLASTMSSGETAQDIQRATYGIPSGLLTNHNKYLGAIDDLRGLLDTAANAFPQYSIREAFGGHIDEIANAARNNFECLSGLALTYKPTSSANLVDVRCMIDDQTYYRLSDKLKAIDACESGVGRKLRDVARLLKIDANAQADSAELDVIYFWRAWLPGYHSQTTVVLTPTVLKGVEDELSNSWCPRGLVVTTHSMKEKITDKLYPPRSDETPVPQPDSQTNTAPPSIEGTPSPAPEPHRTLWDWLFGRQPAGTPTEPQQTEPEKQTPSTPSGDNGK